MAIATRCPHCNKGYSLKDELAGKRVTCANPNCKKIFTAQALSPVAASPPSANGGTVKAAPKAPLNVEDLALSALADEAKVEAPQEQVVTATIQDKCKHCDHVNVFEARMAGKNAPCQNEECRKILKVPLPKKTDPKDWRTVQRRPSAARTDTEQLEGVWGNVQSTAVSREAILEAEAGRVDDREPRSWGKILQIAAIAAGILLFLVIGTVFVVRRRSEGKQERSMELALELATGNPKKKEAPKITKDQAGLIHLLAGQYEFKRDKAKAAKDHFVTARGGLDQRTGNTHERCVALVEIAAGLAELSGTKEQSEQGSRLEWDKDKLGGDVRATLTSLPSMAGDDGRDIRAHAFRRLTRALASAGNSQAAVGLANAVAPSEDRGELLAVIALELLALGQREDAEKIAKEASISPGANASSLIALWLALGSADASEDKRRAAVAQAQKLAPPPAGDATLTALARIGYADGLARQGKIDDARKLAMVQGKPEERLRARVAVAAVVVQSKPNDLADLEWCLKLLDGELKNQPVAPWLVLRLAELAARAENADLAGKFAAKIADPGLRAWAQLEGLRAKLKSQTGQAGVVDLAKEVGGPDRLAHWLAWTELARHNAGAGAGASEVGQWESDAQRAFGYAGVALAER